ncbi:conserved hypothetical protein [Rhodococcus sp. RD6.2]|nr:conserved hypothetical protein [Rhodococcus sp. RD6.2]
MTITDDAPRAHPSRDPKTRARLARIFGDVLPETTGDERSPEDARDSSSDDWLRRQVPPHHG